MTVHPRPVRSRRWFAALGVLVVASCIALATPAYATPAYATPALTARAGQNGAAAQSAALATGYTYWAYFTWDESSSSWELAPVGANDKKIAPEDGDVFGFRWALNVGTGSAREPRADGDFAAICGDATTTDEPRVAFVLDYGTTTDAVGDDETPQPRGVCATVRDAWTVQQTLQSVVDVRTASSGLVCGIDGYPSRGCGETVKNAQQPPADEPVDLVLPGEEGSGDSQTSSPSSSSDAADESDDDSTDKLWTIGIPVLVVVLLGVGALVLRRRQS